MRIGIIGADLIGRTKHRFPNLASEKISGYHKDIGDEVHLLTDYGPAKQLIVEPGAECEFDHIYISKAFTDTTVPEWTRETDNVHLGGTGFFFDKASELPYEIEHHMPDYHLYDEWIEGEVNYSRRMAEENGAPFNETSFRKKFREYDEYSIGFLTRGCFRKCGFCVNQKYDRVFAHSALEEFMDPERKKLCFLDDNFFGCSKWHEILDSVLATGKPFKFKQGLDERLLTEEKCRVLFSSNYDGDFVFAFDNIADYQLIESKLRIIREHTDSKNIKFYVLVGYESTDYADIENAFRRIELLMRYKCLPYIMRYQNQDGRPWKLSKYKSMYSTMARWCNQPNFFKKMSFRQFCWATNDTLKTDSMYCSAVRALTECESEHPEISRFFDMRYED